MPKLGSEQTEVSNHRLLRRITFWGVVTTIPVIAAIYAGAATLGYNLPRPASHGELQEVATEFAGDLQEVAGDIQIVAGNLEDEREARLKDAIEYVDGRISRQESLMEEYRLRRESTPPFVRAELKRLEHKRAMYEKQLEQVMELD